MQLAVAFGASMFSGAGMMKMGLLAATAIGGFMLRPKVSDKQAGKLNDLKVSGSTYGKGIPKIWGTMRVTGNMIWSTDFEEEKHYISSKGKDKGTGKKASKKGTPVFEYFANFAMGICEGPVEELLRIWADGNLIYDKYNPGGYTDQDGIFHEVVRPGFSQQNGDTGKTGGNKSQKGKGNNGDSNQWSWTWYNGSESQMQEPFMVQKSARPNPAYRGLAYLFFRKLALKDFGNRTPTITCEVAVRRQRMPDFRFFTELTQAEGGIRNWSTPHVKAYADFTRYRLYEEAIPDPSDPNCAHPGSKYLRVYDLTKAQEIAQVAYVTMGTITEFSQGFVSSANSEITSGVGDLIGINEQGDCVFNSAVLANTSPVLFVETGGFKIYKHFGYFSNVDLAPIHLSVDGLLAGAKAIPRPVIAFPVGMQAVPDPTKPDGGVDPDTQKAAEFYGGCLVLSIHNDFVYISDGNFFERPTFGDTPDQQVPSRGAPGLPDMGGTRFYSMESYGGFTARMWEGNANWVQPEFVYPITHPYNGTGPVGDYTLIFEATPDATKGDYGVNISDPVTFTGTKEMGLFWSRLSHNTSRDGLYFTLYDVSSTKTKLIWEKHLPDWPLPDTVVLQQAGLSNSNKISYRAGDWVYEIDVFKQEASKYQLPSTTPDMAGGQAYWSARGAILHLCKDADEGGRVKWVMGFLDKFAQTSVTIEEICADFCTAVGIDSFRVDMSKMVTDSVIGYIIENPTSARSLVEELAKVYFFDVTESDYTLKFVARGQDPIMTITQGDLGEVQGDSGGGEAAHTQQKTLEYYKEVKQQEIDCPQRVDVSFINSEKEYENGTQGYQRPRSPVNVLQTRQKLDLNLPIAMSPDGAKQMAQKAAMSIWAERVEHDFTLPWTYLALDPTDVVTFVMDDGLTFTDRLTQVDVGADLSEQVKTVTQTASTYSSDIKGNRGGGNVSIPKPVQPNVRPLIWDLPLLRDDDADKPSTFQFYWGAKAFDAGFRYADLQAKKGTDDWKTIDGTEFDCLWGIAYGQVPPPPNGAWATDDQSHITLGMGWDFSDLYDWESIPDAHWPSTDNAILIGDELIYFKNVTHNADKTVTIDTLIRGARGTEANAYTHGPSETWTLINLSGFHVHSELLTYLNQSFGFRTLSPTLLSMLALSTRKTLTGASLKPHPVTDFRRDDTSGDSTISWKRRTRIGGPLQNGTDVVPLAEDFEQYEAYVVALPIDYPGVVFDPTNAATYLRAFTGLTTPQFTYTAAMKTADGFSETAGAVTHPHQRWRVRSIAKTANGNDRAAWSEVRFGLSNNHTTGTASAGSYYNASDANLAFDGDKTTYWQSYSTPLPGDCWVGYAFAAPVTVTEVQLRVPFDSFSQNVPLQWVIECSDDNGATWQTAYTSPLFTSYKPGQLITVSLAAPVPEGMHLAVFQMSGEVGRGFASGATLPKTHLT